MRDIAKLLLGRESSELDDLFAPGDGDVFGLAEQTRRAGDWCGSTPRGGSVADALFGDGRSRPAPGRRDRRAR
jgi:hypothetical protein